MMVCTHIVSLFAGDISFKWLIVWPNEASWWWWEWRSANWMHGQTNELTKLVIAVIKRQTQSFPTIFAANVKRACEFVGIYLLCWIIEWLIFFSREIKVELSFAVVHSCSLIWNSDSEFVCKYKNFPINPNYICSESVCSFVLWSIFRLQMEFIEKWIQSNAAMLLHASNWSVISIGLSSCRFFQNQVENQVSNRDGNKNQLINGNFFFCLCVRFHFLMNWYANIKSGRDINVGQREPYKFAIDIMNVWDGTQ